MRSEGRSLIMSDKHFEASFEPEIRQFAGVVRGALTDAGEFDLVMRSEADPLVHLDVIEPILDRLGVLDLVPHESEDQLQAAAAACQAAGSVALPYPLAERLAGTSAAIPPGASSNGRPRALSTVTDGSSSSGRARVNMGGLDFEWWVVEAPSGLISRAILTAPSQPGRLGPFVADMVFGAPETTDLKSLALSLHLQSFTLLGMLDTALRLTVDHTNYREQFGAPIVTYQAVQHQLADALIALEAFESQTHYALWSISQDRTSQLVDVVGARLAGLQAADIIIRAGHQLHGATGFCDETPISWVSRHSQPLRRLPLDRARTDQWFVNLVVRQGFEGLFSTGLPDTEQPVQETEPDIPAQLVSPIWGATA